MEWPTLIKEFLEIGLLGLSGCIVIYATYHNFILKNKKIEKDDDRMDEKDKKNEDRFDKALKLIEKQNEDYHEQLFKQMELLTNSIVNGVVTHTVSPEENEKLMKVTNEIDRQLQDIISQTDASRACLVQYHNGGRGVNKQSFLKMSMTNEQVQLGVTPIMNNFKDIFRSTLAYFVKELDESGYCYINDSNDLKETDISMYEFLSSRGVQSKYGIALNNSTKDMVIAFICIEFMDKDLVDLSKIDRVLNEKQKILETLLNL